ncbi:TrmB family transcriptional regulator, partial [Thermoproteota archaeon]
MAIDTSILKDIGLTNAQIMVYLALLELGESTSGPVIRKSKLQNSVVYNALNQLIEHGLVTFVLRGKRKYFSAENPKNLIRFVEDKKERIEELVPQLVIRQKLAKSKQEARVFLGWKGIYNAFNQILEELPKGSDYIGFAGGFEEQYTEESKRFFREFQKKRNKKQYKIKLIANETSREQVRKYEYYDRFGKPEYRFVPGFAPVGVIIFGDNVLNVAFEETPVAVII